MGRENPQTKRFLVQFLPRDAMNKRGLCRHVANGSALWLIRPWLLSGKVNEEISQQYRELKCDGCLGCNNVTDRRQTD